MFFVKHFFKCYLNILTNISSLKNVLRISAAIAVAPEANASVVSPLLQLWISLLLNFVKTNCCM